MTDLFISIATTAGQVLGWWFLISVGTFAIIYPVIRMARDEPEPARIRIVAINGRRIGER